MERKRTPPSGARLSSAIFALSVLTLAALTTRAPTQTVWEQVNPVIAGRDGHRTVYDSARGEVVRFGGRDALGRLLNETWVWDGSEWSQRQPQQSPPARYSHAMAYDAARGRVVLFGGIGTRPLSDTWEWDGVNWVERTPPAGPEARYGHVMAYEVARQRVVLFGGGELTSFNEPWTLYGEVWEWDGATWTSRAPATRPEPRAFSAMAYDSARGRLVLASGINETGVPFQDTWEWDGAAWSRRSVGTGPSGRSAHTLAYDSARNRIVLFGGRTRIGAPLGETWEWNGTSWSRRSPEVRPSPRADHSMSYHTARGRVVLFSGNAADGDTWEWDGSSWSEVGNIAPPASYLSYATAYHAGSQRTIAFGAEDPSTWAFDGTTWRRVSSSGPPPRSHTAMAYDNRRDQVILFGGNDDNIGWPLPDTWAWDGSKWTQVGAAGPARAGHVLAYDSGRDRIVMFWGGSGTVSPETWEWTRAGGWVQQFPANSPAARSDTAMAYDEARGRVLLFGGIGGCFCATGRLDDTWEWDGTDWTRLAPVSAPEARDEHGMTYDAARQRIVLFGGQSYDAVNRRYYYQSDTWEWNGRDWEQRAPSTTPAARSNAQLSYDSTREEVVLFGGISNSLATRNETWLYRARDPAGFSRFGSGCSGTAGEPSLTGSRPWLGEVFGVELSMLPSSGNAAFLWFGASRTQWGAVGLPFALGLIGMPGCDLLVSPDVTVPLASAGGSASWSALLGLPSSALGVSLFLQGGVLDPGANAAGVVLSNGGHAELGAK